MTEIYDGRKLDGYKLTLKKLIQISENLATHLPPFLKHYTSVCVLSHVQLFVTSLTVGHQAPLSMEFSRQEY